MHIAALRKSGSIWSILASVNSDNFLNYDISCVNFSRNLIEFINDRQTV